jgi:hypothetical protein
MLATREQVAPRASLLSVVHSRETEQLRAHRCRKLWKKRRRMRCSDLSMPNISTDQYNNLRYN